MNIYEKLVTIQTELKAPKNQYNSFGRYSYRNCEDILEALKPILKKTKTTVTVSDSVVQIGERYYITATATLTDAESGEAVNVTAYAREEESKKGMDSSQVTGSTSSYARKYALNGMFAIDDNKDSDTPMPGDTTDRTPEKVPPKKTAPVKKQALICADCGQAITDTKGENGTLFKSEKIADKAMKKFGRKLCLECAQKANNAAKTQNYDNIEEI